jgi:trk system potassium uptake protein TrkA
LLTYIRQGDIATVYSLRRGAAEAIETIAHGDSHTSRVVGRKIEDLKLPPGTTIGAIVRGEAGKEKVLMAHDDVIIESDDHVILFLVDKEYVHDVERLFQVDATFI